MLAEDGSYKYRVEWASKNCKVNFAIATAQCTGSTCLSPHHWENIHHLSSYCTLVDCAFALSFISLTVTPLCHRQKQHGLVCSILPPSCERRSFLSGRHYRESQQSFWLSDNPGGDLTLSRDVSALETTLLTWCSLMVHLGWQQACCCQRGQKHAAPDIQQTDSATSI